MKNHLIYKFSVCLLALCGVSACTVNINSNANENSNQNNNRKTITTDSSVKASPTISKARWTTVVCSSRAGEVILQAGSEENDSQTFATWKAVGSQKVYDMPARLQNLTQIHFRAIGSESKPVEICVLYDGKPKKRVSFDEGSEDHTVKADAGDDNDCRCVQ